MPEPVSGVDPWVIYEDRYSPGMGEVRVRVRLTNASDELLAQDGILTPDRVRGYETTALVDTGTTHTVVPAYVAQQLGLTVRDEILVQFADARLERAGLVGPLLIEIEGRRTHDAALVTGQEVLVGQTVLGKLDWSVDCRDQRLIQNPRHPSGPVFRI